MFERETLIRTLGTRIETCADRAEQRRLFAQMVELIRGRTPQTVAAMESARGLIVARGGLLA